MALDEHGLSKIMGEAVGDVRPPTRALVDGATRQGRRMRGRRRIAVAAGVLAVVGAVTGTSLLGAHFPTYTDRVETLSAGPGAEPGEVRIPDFSNLPENPQPPAGTERITGRAAVQTLKELMPEGRTSGYESRQGPLSAYEVYGRLNSGGWPAGAEVQVNLQPGFGRDMFVQQDGADRASTLKGFYSCEHRAPEVGRMSACGVSNLSDGSVLMVYEARSGLLLSRHADLLRTDGTRILVGTSNGADVEGGPVVALKPPLSLAELRDIATSSRWQCFVDPQVNETAKSLTPHTDRSRHFPADGSVPAHGTVPVDDSRSTATEPSSSTRH
ncbi:hypothetical protein ACIRJR_03315 [Streptomyces sp. NPDC102402]|uniref:hypothetical protein n=1 Tax=Streptomyces sp. NPDC102402 TaxID=3366169 RepID=UPI003820DC3E